jgi:DUF1365 family protein
VTTTNATSVAAPTRPDLKSALFTGQVFHQRYAVAEHGFSYPLYMLAIDLDETERLDRELRWFRSERFAPFSLRRADYLDDASDNLKDATLKKVAELGGQVDDIDRVVLLGQVRCFGIYFSPVNFFFCLKGDEPLYMLAEVHNTPWNETHCYLVNLGNPGATPKRFHVSPFMDLDMRYQWKINWRDDRVVIHIENWRDEKLFDATLTLHKQALTSRSLLSILKQWPVMTLTIVRAIYWQALKLFIKRVPYHSHP